MDFADGETEAQLRDSPALTAPRARNGWRAVRLPSPDGNLLCPTDFSGAAQVGGNWGEMIRREKKGKRKRRGEGKTQGSNTLKQETKAGVLTPKQQACPSHHQHPPSCHQPPSNPRLLPPYGSRHRCHLVRESQRPNVIGGHLIAGACP